MAVRTIGDDFSSRLGRFYGLYVAILAAILALLGGLERLGADDGLIVVLFLVFALCGYAGIGLLSRTTRVTDFFVGRRTVASPLNGAVIAAGMVSTPLLLVMVGGLTGAAAAAALFATAAASVFFGLALAPYLRKLGAYTASEFLGVRFASRTVGFLAFCVILVASFLHLVALLDFGAWLALTYFGFRFDTAIYLGLVAILACVLIGGLRALTWTVLAQFVVLVAAALVTLVLGPDIFTGTALPDGAAEALRELSGVPEAPLAGLPPAALAALLASFSLGTIILPSTQMRALAAADPRAARRGFLWAVPALCLVGAGLPAYAAFTLTGAEALSATIAGLVAAAALSAALATGAGLALGLGNLLANDLWFRTIDRRAPAGRRLLAARILMVVIVAAAARVALSPPGGILPVAALGLGTAAGGLLPALLLAVWWRRCTAGGAAAGIVVGAGIALAYGLFGQFGLLAGLPLPGAGAGVAGLAATMIAIPAGLLAAIAVSLMSPEPSPELHGILAEIRRPRGETILAERPA